MNRLRYSPALTLRAIIGLVIGAIGGAALTDLVLMVMALIISAYLPSSPEAFSAMLAGGFGHGAMRGASFVLPVALIACWPAHLLLLRIGWRNALAYGLGWGVLILTAYLVAPYYMGATSFGWIVAMQLMTGFLAGLLFWLIRRPDRDAANTQDVMARQG